MTFRILLDGVEREVDIVARRPQLIVSIDGRRVTVGDPGGDADGLDRLQIGGRDLPLARARTLAGLTLRANGRTYNAELLGAGDDAGAGASGELRAPMPGAVVSVEAAEGDTVAMGDPILTIESMKLQTVLSAPRAGTVGEILVAEGELFDKDQLLARLADDSEGEDDA